MPPTSFPPGDYVLDVGDSITGRLWQARNGDERLALALTQRFGLPEIVGRVLANRGISLEEAGTFLEPTLRALLPDPATFKDMEKGCERLAGAVMEGEHIAIFGDYDVDGATSAALLKRFLAAVGTKKATVYIPDRQQEGYGPNQEALLALKEQGASLVVTVDCGTSAHDPLAAAAKAGLDVIVIDHHEAEPKLPSAVAVINPNRVDESGDFRQLAAVGVTFLTIVGLNRALRRIGWYQERPEPDLMQWLDLVALGTICDMVPLSGVNRALVVQGLKVMEQRANPGIKALADVAGIDAPLAAYHAGYLLGPRINAGGRVGKSDLGARLLSNEDEAKARELAHQLDALNQERRQIEAAVYEEALAHLEAGDGPLALVAGKGWHPGVIGIVASRLKDTLNRPVCVVALDGDKGVGSGRSVRGVDLGGAIIAARQAGILEKGGGHVMAAGFTVAGERLGELCDFLNERIKQALDGRPLIPSLGLDGVLSVGGATMSLIDSLERLGPFGSGNPEPRFAFSSARLAHAMVVGGNHVKCSIQPGQDGVGRKLQAIAFRSMETPLGQALLGHDGAPLHLAGRLKTNHWQGRTWPQLIIDDAAKVW